MQVYFLGIDMFNWIYFAAFCLLFSIFSAWLLKGIIIASANILISLISLTLSIVAISGRGMTVDKLTWGTEREFLSNMEAYVFVLMFVIFFFSSYASIKQYFWRG